MDIKKVDFNNIFSTLLIAAIVFLFSSILSLNSGISKLSTQLAVMEERNKANEDIRVKSNKNIEELVKIVGDHSSRITKIEWQLNTDKESR